MYLTISIGQSHIERPTRLFIKKFFFCFRCDGELIFPHLNLPPNKNHPEQVHATIPQDTQTQSFMTNFLSINPLSTS